MKNLISKGMVLTIVLLLVSFSLVGCGSTQGETEQQYPTKAIQMIVPYNAGDASDLSARVFAEQIQSVLGQPMTVVNKGGGGGSIGAAEVAKAKADGYTLLNGSFGLITAQPYMQDVGYTYEDFKPVAQMIEIPLALGVHKDSPFNSLKELVEYAKENPGELKYSIPGAGTIQHVTMELFCSENGIEMVAMPYQGGAPALTAVLSKDVDAVFVGASVLSGQYESGDIKVLGATTSEPVHFMPDVPTFKDQGYDVEAGVWFGVFAPKDTPDEIVQLLSDTLEEIYNKPEVQEQWQKMNLQPSFLNSEDFAKRVISDAENNQQVLKEIGMAK
jgi:tripartite-type tricarboxylate transporter receptor subunit TctC